MNRNEAITGLAEYALDKELIRPEEKIWAVNSSNIGKKKGGYQYGDT